MSLDSSYDDDNIFAKIIRGDVPCVKLYETDAVLGFMDVFPQSEGHCLVIHKSATATNLFDIEQDALAELTAAVQIIAEGVKAGLKPDGVRIAQFNGAAAGQTVFHLHFHIIPVYENTTLAAHGSAGPRTAESLEPVADKIRKAI
ncbi:HIT family protein [Hyphococcus flavus]|uniref:HIT family protein n=1 Tax=Hyphococcus flavus TaxID=1866326 RepID=A0AAF0CEJ3_9PROT|nr:HIT family protein [Hyphococcus flavus]WDI31361.1 HIT family protein [Hyphococcus flavus]